VVERSRKCSSYEVRMVDALASRAFEGRGTAAISLGEPLAGFDPGISEIRKRSQVYPCESEMTGTWRTETSQYPQEKKENSNPLVAASERGAA